MLVKMHFLERNEGFKLLLSRLKNIYRVTLTLEVILCNWCFELLSSMFSNQVAGFPSISRFFVFCFVRYPRFSMLNVATQSTG